MKKQASKIFDGVIASTKMQKTAVIEITRQFPHPLYRKLIKKDRRLNVDIGDFIVKVGEKVKITETKPISKTKHFRILEVISDGSA